MSGICGICEPGRDLSTSELSHMVEQLALPDESERDVRRDGPIAVGVARRWSFQQVATVNGITVAADADLVDFSEASEALSMTLAEACSVPVAELIAGLYLTRGVAALNLLRGSFALAVWDTREQRLLLAIDRLGIRSLYVRREGNRLLFASRAGAIRAAQRDPVEVNPTAVLQFLLFSAVPAPLASDRGTEKLRPGTFVSFSKGNLTEHTYWDLEYPESEDRSVTRWARELREQMRVAVHRHLEGCLQPQTGCYLSGGTDSSSVVAFTGEKHRPAQSFSIAFKETGFSEAEFARTTAAHFQTKHHEKWLTAGDASEALEKTIACYDEPFANSSAVGAYHCALLARENGVRTLLAGDGGDELFAGNARYAHDKYFALYHRVPSAIRRSLLEPLLELLPLNGGKLSYPRKYAHRANIPNPRRIFSYNFFLSLPPREVFEDGFLQQVGMHDWLSIPEDHFRRANATSELNRILYLDLKMTIADNDIRKVSGTAELAGVHVRYPLLDDRLAEFSGRIPARLKLRGFEKRYIFKQAMKGILPDKVLYKKKHGFGVPLAQWLLNDPQMKEVVRDVMYDSRTRERGYFRKSFFEQLMSLHKEQPNYYGEIVWYLLSLELWHRRHLEPKRQLALHYDDRGNRHA